MASLRCLNEAILINLEQQVDQKRGRIIGNNLKCKHYMINSSEEFKFLLGHKQLLLNFCQNIGDISPSDKFSINSPAFQPVLREMITASLKNYNKSENIRRFPELLIQFAIYIYILAGKQSYEVLCSNMMLPKSGTICKFQ